MQATLTCLKAETIYTENNRAQFPADLFVTTQDLCSTVLRRKGNLSSGSVLFSELRAKTWPYRLIQQNVIMSVVL